MYFIAVQIRSCSAVMVILSSVGSCQMFFFMALSPVNISWLSDKPLLPCLFISHYFLLLLRVLPSRVATLDHFTANSTSVHLPAQPSQQQSPFSSSLHPWIFSRSSSFPPALELSHSLSIRSAVSQLSPPTCMQETAFPFCPSLEQYVTVINSLTAAMKAHNLQWE